MITVPKLFLMVLVVIAVWFAMRWLNRTQTGIVRRSQPQPPGAAPQGAIEDLVACRACGAYVAANARACGKAGCPQPR